MTTNDDRNILLVDALRRIRRVEQRLVGTPHSIRVASRQADRNMLAANIESIRLDLDHIYGLIENEIDYRAREAMGG